MEAPVTTEHMEWKIHNIQIVYQNLFFDNDKSY